MDKKEDKFEIDLLKLPFGKMQVFFSTVICGLAVLAGVYFGFEGVMVKGDWSTFFITLLVLLGIGPAILVIVGIWLKGKGIYTLADIVMRITQLLAFPGRIVNFTMWEIGAYSTRIEIYLELGELEKASQLGARVQSLANGNTGVPKDDVAMEAAMLYGIVEAKKGNFDKAIKFGYSKLVDAKSVFEQNRSMENAKTLASAFNSMGSILETAERFSEARSMHESALNLRTEYLGEGNPLTGYPMANIGYTYLREGKFEEAETKLKKARETISDTIHEMEGIDSDCKAWLADALLSQGKVDEAERLIDQNHRFRLKKRAENGEKMAYSKVLKGKLSASKGNYDEANRYLDEAISALDNTSGYYKSQLKYALDSRTEVATKSGDKVLLKDCQKKAKLICDEVESKSKSVVLIDKIESIDFDSSHELPGKIENLPAPVERQSELTPIAHGKKRTDKIHPLLSRYLRRDHKFVFVLIGFFVVFYLVSTISSGGSLNFYPLALVVIIMLIGALPIYLTLKKLREINNLVISQQPEEASVAIEQQTFYGSFKKTSGFINSTASGSGEDPKKRLYFDDYGDLTQFVKFDGSQFQALVYRDPKTGKVKVIETKRVLLVVSDSFLKKLSPSLQLASGGAAFVFAYLLFIVAFAFIGSPPLPDTVPEDLTAREYLRMGKRFARAGHIDKSRQSLKLAIDNSKEKDKEIVKEAKKFIEIRLPHKRISKDAIALNVEGEDNWPIWSRDKAEKAWKECIEKYPDFEIPYDNLASLYKMQGKLDEAEVLLEKAIEINPKYATAIFRMARLQRDKNNPEKAVFYLDRVLELDPDNDYAQELRTKMKNKIGS